MSFSQLVAICMGDNKSVEEEKCAERESILARCDAAIDRFEEAIFKNRIVQYNLSKSSKLTSESCAKVVECLGCPARKLASLVRKEFEDLP